jgi:hypothetical protein
MPDQIADHLGKSLADLVAESQALRGDIHNAEQARRRASRVNLGLTMLLVAFVVALLAVGWQNNRLSHQVAATNATLADCTVTGGKCYEEGKARTGAAITAVLHAEVAAVECARLWPGESGPELNRKLEACVDARLAEYNRQAATPTPAPAPSPSPSR